MHAASQIPDEGTYSRVLRRYDRDPRHAHQMRFASYDVNLRAVAAAMDGVTAPTLFFPLGKERAADRATRECATSPTMATARFSNEPLC